MVKNYHFSRKIKSYLRIVSALLLFQCSQEEVRSQTIFTESTDAICNFSRTCIIASDEARINRTNFTGRGKIVINYVGTAMPDSLKRAINIAADIWRDYMDFGDSLNLRINFSPLADKDLSTDIYLYRNLSDSLYYPNSLYRKISNQQTDNCPFDARISINSDTQWCIGIGNGCTESKKLVLTSIQQIGRALGYGASVEKSNYGFKFIPNNGITTFDKIVFSENNQRLEEQNGDGMSQFINFVQPSCGYLYALKHQEEYKIYAPSIFDDNFSLKYSAFPGSTMYYGDEPASAGLEVDRATIDILSGIGWDWRSSRHITITGAGIDSTGITSAYQSHVFRAFSETSPITNYQWKYMLPLSSGIYQVVTTSTSSQFIIPSISHEERYQHTSDGDIKGRIVLVGLVDGIEVTAQYNLTLETRPRILHAEVISISTNPDDDSCIDATIGVFYEGSKEINASVENINSTQIDEVRSETPYYTQIELTGIDIWEADRIRLTTANEYGTDSFTIDISDSPSFARTRSSVLSLQKMTENNMGIDVYNCFGILLGNVLSVEALSDFTDSILILKGQDKNGYSITKKYYRK